MRSLPGPFWGMAPEKMTNPVLGTSLKSLRRCITFVIASWTFFRVVSDLMFVAVPYSCLRLVITSATCLPGGTNSETSSVPRPSFLLRVDSAFLSRKRSSDVRFWETGVVLTWCFRSFGGCYAYFKAGIDKNCLGGWLVPLRWTGRDLNPRLPDCESGVHTKLNYRPALCFLYSITLSLVISSLGSLPRKMIWFLPDL